MLQTLRIVMRVLWGVESAAGSAAEKSTVAAPCVVAARSIARDGLRPVEAAHVKRRACLPRLASCWHNPAAEPPSSSPPLSAPPRGVLPRQQKNESLVGLPAEGAQEQCGATWTRLEQSLGAPIARRTGGCCLKEMRIAQRSCDSRRCYFQGTAAPSRAGSASIASASRARFSSLPRERQTRRCAGHAPYDMLKHPSSRKSGRDVLRLLLVQRIYRSLFKRF